MYVSLKQIVHGYFFLDNATVFSVGDTKGGNHGKMNRLFGREGLF
jgi:hypothetical protein